MKLSVNGTQQLGRHLKGAMDYSCSLPSLARHSVALANLLGRFGPGCPGLGLGANPNLTDTLASLSSDGVGGGGGGGADGDGQLTLSRRSNSARDTGTIECDLTPGSGHLLVRATRKGMGRLNAAVSFS